MILGIGNDIVEISRIAKAISNEKFLKRVYTEKEIEIISKKGDLQRFMLWVLENAVHVFGHVGK